MCHFDLRKNILNPTGVTNIFKENATFEFTLTRISLIFYSSLFILVVYETFKKWAPRIVDFSCAKSKN